MMLCLQMKLIKFLLALIVITLGFTPQIVEIQLQIAELQAHNKELKYKRCRNHDVAKEYSQQLIPIKQNSLSFNSVCLFNQSSLQSFFVQSSTHIYLVVNFHNQDLIKIYDSQCQELSVLSSLQVMSLLTDRGQIQSGLAYIIGKDEYLYALREEGGFKNMTKIVSLVSQTTIVGGFVRYRGKEKIQIFTIYKDGAVKVIDQSGSIKFTFQLGNHKTQIDRLIDRHPYPLVSTNSDWIFYVDTSKYSYIQQSCPHIPNIKAVISQSVYSDIVYILTPVKIYAISLEHSKRQCRIKHEYSFDCVLSNIKYVSYFGNSLFIDEKVYNMTEKKLYRWNECSNETQYQFVINKNYPDQSYSLRKSCKQGIQLLEYGKINKKPQQRHIFIWLSIIFALVILLSLSFMRKSNVSNLDIDDAFQQKQRKLDLHYYQISKQNKQKLAKSKKK